MLIIRQFKESLDDSRQLRHLYKHCVENLNLPGSYCDLLRMSVTYSMSALDKLIHDLVVYGMVETYAGRRVATIKFQSEGVSIQNHIDLNNASVPPAEILFEGIVRQKISHLSFLDPKKMAEALSLVWNESHKWQAISNVMGRDQNDVKTELSNIYRRRNAIVHEADKDPVSNTKMPLLATDAERIENFIRDLGDAIYGLVY
jgi:uncharacterized protein YlaN (UPF0358 family)